jgi:hypothetical protein
VDSGSTAPVLPHQQHRTSDKIDSDECLQPRICASRPVCRLPGPGTDGPSKLHNMVKWQDESCDVLMA